LVGNAVLANELSHLPHKVAGAVAAYFFGFTLFLLSLRAPAKQSLLCPEKPDKSE
jgi:hypothetical protein